jgi:TatD DNase family protein
MGDHLSLINPVSSWIDLHAHLDRLSDSELSEALAEAAAAGVSAVCVAATDLASAEAVSRQCATHSSLWGAVGISPFSADSLPDNWQARLRSLLLGERIIAIGEIGLNETNTKYPPLSLQLPVFERQLEIARECDLPVILHSRGAESRVASLCMDHSIKRAVFHCFTGDSVSLATILDSGYSVSFSGIVTFSRRILGRVAEVPLDRLFIETDSPWLSPVPYRGQANRPSRVAIIGEAIAKALGIFPRKLQEAIEGNFSRLFTPMRRENLLFYSVSV